MLDEPGTDQARDLFTTASLIQSSWLLVPEAHSAVARARRNRRFSPSGDRRARGVLGRLLLNVESLALNRVVAEQAATFAAGLGLRGPDAVHLATYALIESEESVLVAADGALSRAALSLGYAVAIPRA